jgi:hypothetical protein
MGSAHPGSESGESGGGASDERELASELRERIAEAEALRKQLGPNSEAGKRLGEAIEKLQQINRSSNAMNNPAVLAMLKNDIIPQAQQVELELARQLQDKLGGSPGALGEGDAPDRYKKVIDDYYRRLSTRSTETQKNWSEEFRMVWSNRSISGKGATATSALLGAKALAGYLSTGGYGLAYLPRMAVRGKKARLGRSEEDSTPQPPTYSVAPKVKTL